MPTPHPQPEQIAGDEGELYRLYHDRLVRHVTAAVNAPRVVIEDACQNAWSALLRTQPRRETIFAWLRVVAIREAWALAERERRDLVLDATDHDTSSLETASWLTDPRANADRRLETLQALELVAELPQRQRRLLGLHISGYTYRQIAQITDDTPRTVDRQLRRAHLRLHQLRAEGGHQRYASR